MTPTANQRECAHHVWHVAPGYVLKRGEKPGISCAKCGLARRDYMKSFTAASKGGHFDAPGPLEGKP